MQSLAINYLNSLLFSSEQVSTLKTLGEYKGRQDLFRKQTPEVLESGDYRV